jgi:hypothetical protein
MNDNYNNCIILLNNLNNTQKDKILCMLSYELRKKIPNKIIPRIYYNHQIYDFDCYKSKLRKIGGDKILRNLLKNKITMNITNIFLPNISNAGQLVHKRLKTL